MSKHDVFVSYSRDDRAKVQRIANALNERGLRVWWDPEIKTGSGFRNEIADALDGSKSVVVIWSRHSVASRFVADEADEGAAREILYPALIDNVDIPLGFRQIQTADLTHWRGNLNDDAFKAFVETVANGAGVGPAGHKSEPAPQPTTPAPAPTEEVVEKVSPPSPKEKPAKTKTVKKSATKPNRYTTTGSKRRFQLYGQAVFMAGIIAAAFALLAYGSDFVFSAYRPYFVGAMGLLAFLSRYGTLEADRAAGAASLALLPRSYIALILFSLIAISPLILQGRIYAAALEGVQVKGIEGADINNVTVNGDGTLVLTASDDNTAKVWEVATGVERGEYEEHKAECQDEEARCWIWSGDFSPDNEFAVTASRDRTADIWKVATSSHIRTLAGHRASIYDVAWHPAGEVIATASSDNTIKLWHPETGDVIRTLNAHSDNVNAIDFSPDGKVLASASKDGMMRLWDWQNGGRMAALSIGAAGNDVKFSGSGEYIAAAADNGTIRVWETASRKRTLTFSHGAPRAFAVAFADEDRLLATSGIDPVIRVWNMQNGALVRELEAHKDGVRGLDATADGTTLISGSRDNTIRVWDATSGVNDITMGHIKSAIDLPMAIDLPPFFVASQAPVPVDFAKEPETAGTLIGKGVFVAFVLLIGSLILKGIFWLVRLKPVARLSVVGVLFAAAGYTGLLIAATLPIEALALWLTIAFVPATLFAFMRWMWRIGVLRNLNRRTRVAN